MKPLAFALKAVCLPTAWHRMGRIFLLVLAAYLCTHRFALASACESSSGIHKAFREVTLNGVSIQRATVSVPDVLDNAWKREGIKVRYTLDVTPCRAVSDQTLWLPRVGAPYQLRIQGRPAVPVHPYIAPAKSGESDEAPYIFNGRAPMLFRIPPGTYDVEVELLTLPYIPAGIAMAEFGPFADLFPKHIDYFNGHTGGMTVTSLITVVVGCVAIVLWRNRRGDRYIYWFGLMCMVWGLRGYFYANETVDIPALLFEQINPFTVGLFAITCLQTTLLLLDRSTAKHNKGLIIAATTLCVSFALSLGIGKGALLVRAAGFGFGLLMLIYTAVFIWCERAQLGLWRAGLIVAGFASLVAASVHDLMIVLGWLSPERGSMVLLGFNALMLAYAVVCAHFVIRTLNQAEISNELLEFRVAEKTLALEQSYERLRTIELTQAQIQERERLLRDMHDGVGAQLITALRGLERGVLDKDAIAHALQDGLDDLRMLMDNADPQATLTQRLAAWRNRWDTRLTTLGLQLHWHLSDDIDDLVLPGDTSLQLLRVVQEACTNVIKHAQASQIWLTAQRIQLPEGPTLYIEVRDNGRGFDATRPFKQGRGQANIRFRAKQIGAHLAVEPPPVPHNGCCVKLWLPLPA